MRSVQQRTGPALVTAVLAGSVVVLGAAPASAADIFVQVTPSTVQAGKLVGIRASCRDNTNPATVESGAFGTVTAAPQDGLLSASAMVSGGTDPGMYRVRLACPVGPGASATLVVVAGGDPPARGPATGFGGDRGTSVDLSRWLLPGGLAAVVAGLVLWLVAVRGRRTVPGRR